MIWKRGQKGTGSITWYGVSPWLIVGALVILLPIFIFLTLDSLRKQKEHTIQVFLEKGDTLIRSFEAGVRTGRMGEQPDFFRLQKLLIETAQQPDIDFITITDTRGLILADSDPSLTGEYYGQELDLDRISRSRKIEWRQVPNPDGVDTFEVYRRFSPLLDGGDRFPEKEAAGDSSTSRGGTEESRSRQVIFLGINMGAIEKARKDATRQTILTAVLLLLFSSSGVTLLFLAQGYRSARTALSRARAFSDNLMENMPIGLVALDADGNIIAFNQTAEAICRQTPEDVIGKQGNAILPEPFRQIIANLASERGIIEREVDCQVAEGKTVPLEVIATRLEEDKVGFLGYIILFRDLTEMRHLKKEVARSQRLASLGNLAAGVAHEIRNPLSSIKGFATYFKERYRDHPQDGETADIMVQEVERLNRVIGQLLELARPVAMEKRPVSLPALIRQTLKIVEGQARAQNSAIFSDLANDIPEVMMDPDKIKQVLLNLYLNALKAMKEGGALTVKLTSVPGSSAIITVTDQGPGIDRRDLAHIFDPYFTTSPSGTGLGLSIVHKIIEAHDGEINVESVKGEGTKVSIILPIIVRGDDRL